VRRRVAAVDRRGEAVEDDEAEDLDADAPSGSLFGSGFAARPTDDDAPEPPSRPRRFPPREAPAADAPAAPAAPAPAAAAPAPAAAPGTPGPARPEAADLERTQPLSSLPDDDEPERR
jgi:pyruvate dehydrogenase E2 component (dihydrolipoamide acetyltransferase)